VPNSFVLTSRGRGKGKKGRIYLSVCSGNLRKKKGKHGRADFTRNPSVFCLKKGKKRGAPSLSKAGGERMTLHKVVA